MKFINKSTSMFFLALTTLVSCNSFASAPTTNNPTAVMETALSTVKTAIIETPVIPSVTPAVSSTPPATLTPEQQPTLIPTADTEKISDLPNISLSIESLNAFNGYSLQRITGWSNGFSGRMWGRGTKDKPQGYLWMDSSHLLLFPKTGETLSPNWATVTTRPAVMNINTGNFWFPPTDRILNDERWFSIILPRWSPRLQVLITGENIGKVEGASTFTADGKRIAHYEGQLLDISPSAERIFIIGDTWVDLASGKRVDFGWGPGFGHKARRWFPIWSRDENQIYFCCYYYGNANTGQSYTLADDKTIFNGGVFTYSSPMGLDHAYGKWLNDDVVMAQYDAWWYEGPGFIAIFDVSKRTYRDLGAVAGLPYPLNNYDYAYTSISPNGDYMVVSPQSQSPTEPQIYLVDLKTLKSELYHAAYRGWSANGEYAFIGDQVLTLSDKTLRALPSQPTFEKPSYRIAKAWHPTEGVYLSIYTDNQQHLVVNFLDVENLTYREKKFDLPANFNGTYYSDSAGIVWNPLGNRFALAAADGSIWQLDYPQAEHLEQLSMPTADTKDISWSPDGRYLSYIYEADIYIVDTESKP